MVIQMKNRGRGQLLPLMHHSVHFCDLFLLNALGLFQVGGHANIDLGTLDESASEMRLILSDMNDVGAGRELGRHAFLYRHSIQLSDIMMVGPLLTLEKVNLSVFSIKQMIVGASNHLLEAGEVLLHLDLARMYIHVLFGYLRVLLGGEELLGELLGEHRPIQLRQLEALP